MLEKKFRFSWVCLVCFCVILLLGGCEGADPEGDEDGSDGDKPAEFADAILYYEFEEISGTNVENLAGSSFDGTVIGATPVSGSNNLGLDFSITDGSHVHIHACCEDNAGSSSINFGNDSITIAMWLRLNTLSPGTMYPVFGGSYQGKQSPRIRISSNGFLQFILYMHGEVEAPVVIASSTNPLTTNTWTHVAVTYDSTVATIYLDGNPQTNPEPPIKMPVDSIINDFYIGGIPISGDDTDAGGGAHSFPGIIDEFALFDIALEGDEIADLLL